MGEIWDLTESVSEGFLPPTFETRCTGGYLTFRRRTRSRIRRFAERSKQPFENTRRTPDPGQETEAKMVWPCFWSSGLEKTTIQSTVKGKRNRGRQKKRWGDSIKEWTGIDLASSTRAAENRTRWKGIVANSSVVPQRPSKVM